MNKYAVGWSQFRPHYDFIDQLVIGMFTLALGAIVGGTLYGAYLLIK